MVMWPSDPIPLRMKKIRINLGLTQAELAEKIRISPNMISYYETGRVHPTSTVLRRFLLATKASPCYLFDIPEPMEGFNS